MLRAFATLIATSSVLCWSKRLMVYHEILMNFCEYTALDCQVLR